MDKNEKEENNGGNNNNQNEQLILIANISMTLTNVCRMNNNDLK